MPNNPAMVGKGVTGLFASSELSIHDKKISEDILGVTGVTLWVDKEESIDVINSISGSGPAYVFYFMENMMEHQNNMVLI